MPDEPSQQQTPTQQAPNAAQPPPARGRAEYQPQGFRGSMSGEPIAAPPPAAPQAPQGQLAAPDASQGAPDGDDESQGQQGVQDPPVVGHGGKPMSQQAISERVERERRKWLREEYGTDDPKQVEEVRARRKREADEREAREKEYQRLKAEEEKRKRAAMSEQDRLKADLAKKEAELQAAKQQITELRTGTLAEKQEQVISAAATKYIDPDALDLVKYKLARHFSSMTPEEQKKFDARALDRWMSKFAKDNPKFAKPADAPAQQQPDPKQAEAKDPPAPAKVESPKTPKRIPVSTGKPQKAPAPTPRSQDPAELGGKTIKPGQPNSMSRSELNQFLRSQGRRPW